MLCLHTHDKPALIRQDQAVSYSALLENIARYAAMFLHENCDKVAIYAENRLEWVYAFYAAWKTGGIAVPIDFMATVEEVAYILNDCRPEVVFCSKAKEADAREAMQALAYSPTLLVLEDCEQQANAAPIPDGTAFPERDNAETALLIYTSGTTGSPKGAMLSFDNLYVNTTAVSDAVPIYTSEQRVLVFLPLHHIFPLLGTLVMPLYVGATAVFSPSMSPDDLRATLQTGQITILLAVPRLFHMLHKSIREKINASAVTRTVFKLAETLNSPALSKRIFHTVHERFGGHVKFLISGGAAIDNDAARDLKTLGFDLLTGYGMTEAAPMISFTHPGTLKIGASGQPLPSNEVRIVDDEIVAKGRNVMQGYYNRPDETAAVIKNGWLYTGDTGYLDDDNFLFVTGRKKDIIVLPNGKNINPEEIEFKILKTFDTIKEIGVFMADDILQAIVLPDFQKLHERGVQHIERFVRWDVFDAYNHSASPSKKIAQFTIAREELPRTRLGKLRRFQLPSLLQRTEQPLDAQAEPDYEEYQRVKAFLQQQTHKPIFPSAHIELDLALDSLDRVSLQTFLESTFGVEFQHDELLDSLTVEKIAAYVRDKKVKMETEGINWHTILHEDLAIDLPRSAADHVPGVRFLQFCIDRYFAMSVQGVENLPETPCIIVPNHQSMLDSFLIASHFPNDVVKRTYFYGDERHFRQGWRQSFAAHHNTIIMDMNRNLKQSLQKMAAVLKQGGNLVIFPEGARTRDGELGEFKKSFAILACELDVPVVPVVVQGAYAAMPKGARLPRFRQPISLTFLAPLWPEQRGYDELTDAVYQQIRARIGADG